MSKLSVEVKEMRLSDDANGNACVRKSSSRVNDNLGNPLSVSEMTECDQKLARIRRRGSIDQEDVIPFYLRKKYDHPSLSSKAFESKRTLLQRRNAIALEDEKCPIEDQLSARSADLGTISFKSAGIDRSWPKKDQKNNKDKGRYKRYNSNMDFEHKHKSGSGNLLG